MKSNRLRLCLSTAITSVCVATSFTQTSLAQGSASPADDENPQMVADTIIVTARRQEEALNDVPLSVTVTSGDELTTGRTNSLEDLAESTPNVVFNPQAGPITIRGVGSLGINGG